MPGPSHNVFDKINDLMMNELDLRSGAVLEKGCVYVIPLVERLNLPRGIVGLGNPRSTTGRLDIFTRLIVDRGTEFERVPSGYAGRLYVEVVPRTFTVVVRAGMRLNQLRFIRGNPVWHDRRLANLRKSERLVYGEGETRITTQIDRGLLVSVNLRADSKDDVIGYRAKRNAPVLDLGMSDHYEPDEFWEEVRERKDGRMILNPGDFYILGSKEKVRIPPRFAAEMVPFDPSLGEFRIHYAGFFDPGFGHGATGTRAILEVRAHEVPFLIEDGQMVGRLIYFGLLDEPDKLYGPDIGSAYQWQPLALSRQFKRADAAQHAG